LLTLAEVEIPCGLCNDRGYNNRLLLFLLIVMVCWLFYSIIKQKDDEIVANRLICYDVKRHY